MSPLARCGVSVGDIHGVSSGERPIPVSDRIKTRRCASDFPHDPGGISGTTHSRNHDEWGTVLEMGQPRLLDGIAGSCPNPHQGGLVDP